MPMIDVYATKGTFNPHVVGLAGGVGDCGSWQVVDERGGVVLEQRESPAPAPTASRPWASVCLSPNVPAAA
jgi:hypothetical protein